jgi:hypothetical protein
MFKVVEKVLKAFSKAITYYQMTNNHASDHGTTFLRADPISKGPVV